jgi:hypothetical protein
MDDEYIDRACERGHLVTPWLMALMYPEQAASVLTPYESRLVEAARVASDEELRDLERIQPNLVLAVSMYRANDFTGIGVNPDGEGSCSGGD